jgi:hypothetical protein
MAITNNSVLADTIPTVIEEARYTEQFKEVLSKLVWRITKAKGDGATVNLPYFGTVSANNLTDGIDMVNPQSMSDTNVVITPGEVGAQILLSWKLARDNQEDVIRAAGRILGEAMVVKRESDLAGQLDDSSHTPMGGGGTLTLGMIAASWATLSGNPLSSGGPAPKPYVMVHHPFTLLDLVDIFTPTTPSTALTSAGMGDDVLKNYQIGKIFGMDVYESGNISIDSSSNVAKGGVFASGRGGALVLATSKEWDILPDDDPSRRATELNVVGEYGVGEYLASWIVELNNDASTPS